MLERHGELCADIDMAAVTKFRLGLSEQEFWRGGFVYGVALHTADVVAYMHRPVNVGASETFRMTAQARVGRLLR